MNLLIGIICIPVGIVCLLLATKIFDDNKSPRTTLNLVLFGLILIVAGISVILKYFKLLA